ncbi:DUF4174 domain-containing protein [Wenxinia marina]|uniref:DUF4174 domain-containing protein n=1 Tax=Wenxinia marina DSM 24838 TaxID=1123501 RepID=A0A0D0Q8H4_9RHOB|nr:DUF4174 domain-containing protein [Wenxinia marina]KIQ68677.1 hypothetical protein Wenmar_02948 [Wenxinia marina DSM 24838]GGL67854.1 hypothetical protein GCM10011392_22910 [Wenxinia marina]
MKSLALSLALSLSALPLAAQEVASTETPAATVGQELTAVERWQADPAQVFDAADIELDDFLFLARPVVVFADTPNDPRYIRQMEYLLERVDDLVYRDVVIVADTDPGGGSDARTRLRPRGFMLVVMSEDGRVAQRKPEPWDVREIGRAIDKMPLRQRELREGR